MRVSAFLIPNCAQLSTLCTVHIVHSTHCAQCTVHIVHIVHSQSVLRCDTMFGVDSFPISKFGFRSMDWSYKFGIQKVDFVVYQEVPMARDEGREGWGVGEFRLGIVTFLIVRKGT